MMLGIGVGAIAVPFAAQRLIAMFGWRAAYATCRGAVLVIVLPIAAAFLRNDPRDKGLTPDGIVDAMGERTCVEGLTWQQNVVGLALIDRAGRYRLSAGPFFAPRLAALFFCVAAGIVVLMFGAAARIALGAAFLIGMGMGAARDIIAYSLNRYFGLKAFGTAYGYAFGALC
jgi:hypothetical protein